jgi:transcriptional regulator with XRE-family HTH domain
MEFYSELGQQIKRLRESQKITQKALAEKAGITQGEVSHIETGRRSVAIDAFIAIVTALNYAARIEEGKLTFYKVE